MPTKLFIYIFYCILLINGTYPLNSIAAEIEQVVAYNGLQLQGELKNGSIFKFAVSMKPYASDVKLERFWGIDSDKPERVIKEISLFIDDKKVAIPKGAIFDLADINLPCGVYLMQSAGMVFIYLKGGDATSAYTAVLKFKNGKLLSRAVEFINPLGELDSIVTNF